MEDFGPSGVVLVGPTTWATQDVLPVVEVANDLTTTSSTPQPWDANGFLYDKNETVVASFISYGRQPACTSDFFSYAAANPSTTVTPRWATFFTLTNGQTTVAVSYSTVLWPMTSEPHCCGRCSIYFNNLQMLYWPALHPNTACLGKTSAGFDSTSTNAGTAARNQSVYATDSDGYIYTSPSIYVKFPTVSASDACGLIGSVATSITLAFSARELSTFILNDGTGTNYQTFTSALDTAELPCGPWNGTDHFLPEAWSNYSSYQPLIVLPSKLIAMVPAWKSCTADMFEGQDPPRTLNPAAAMAPAPTNVGTQAQNNAASPSPSIPALPHKTGAGVSQQKDPDPDPSPNSPSKPVDPSTGTSGDPSNSNPSPKPSDPSTGDSGDSSSDNLHPKPNDPWSGDSGVPNDSRDPAGNAASAATAPALDPTQAPAGDPPSNGPSNPSAADPSDTKNTRLTLPPAIVLHGHTITQGAAPVTINGMPVVYQSGSISAEGEVKAIPAGWGQGNGNASPMTVGGLTFSAIPSAAIAEGDPQIGNEHAANAAQINDSAAANADSATYITVGGHTIAVDANAISVAGKTLKPGDPGVTIDGTPISLGSSIFIVGSRTETLSPPQAAMTAQPPDITVGGQRVRISSDAIIVDGTTLKPADPGITVDGTLVSLGSSILVVGTHTQNLVLPQPTPSPAPSYMTVGGETSQRSTAVVMIESV